MVGRDGITSEDPRHLNPGTSTPTPQLRPCPLHPIMIPARRDGGGGGEGGGRVEVVVHDY